MGVRYKIALLPAFALALLALTSVANAQYTGPLGRCVRENPGPAGKACCLKTYTGFVSTSDLGRLSAEVMACVASSKNSSKKK